MTDNKLPKRLWERPESGYKEFDDRFNSYYDEAESILREKHPNWLDENEDVRDEHQDDMIGTSCDMAEEWLIEYIKNEHQATMVEQRPFIVTCPGKNCGTAEKYNCIKCYHATHNDQYNDPFEPFREPVMCMNCGTTYQVDENLKFEEN